MKRSSLFAALLTALACAAPPAGVKDISAASLLSDPPDDVLILDVRTPGEYASGHVPGAVNIPHDELAERIGELDAGKDDPVVVYCERGGRAGLAASVLLDEGYGEVLHLDGDMSGWREGELPVETE